MLNKGEKDYINYLLDEKELFARAYSQWIGIKSENQAILFGVKKILENGFDLNYLNQWKESDFKKISNALDTIFKEGDWLK